MDITDQKYMIALAETKSITQAAKRLNISQPALSNWLGTFEYQLGTQLAIRSKKQLVLTPAGQIYLEGSYRMLQIKHQTYAEIANTAGFLKESITISGTPNGGAEVFSRIFSAFRERYPSVSLQFLESYNKRTFDMVLDGTADFGICSSQDVNSPLFEYFLADEKELLLYLPSSHRLSYDASKLKYDAELPTIRLSQLADTPFIMPSADMSYYSGLVQMFHHLSLHPKVLFQSANVKVIYQMVKSGNGAAILPRRLFSPLDPVSPFSLKPRFSTFSTIVCKKGRQLTPAQEYLVQLMVQNT